ncbi:MAG: 7-cyano-7-deazaguanine synthase QueC [Thermoplasmata archaeon]|nr:7-cyano-7-deazaguanine synthase QueC [Thermoplasmata archaeon]
MGKAVVLLSGGLDSGTCAAMAKAQDHDILALTFDYGSRHSKEIEHAKNIAEHLGITEHIIMPLALGGFGGSSLIDESMELGDGEDIPNTYVPARNTVFLSIALALAEAKGADIIYIGANAVDYSGYPDCRPEFIKAFEEAGRLGTKRGVEGNPIKILAPLIDMTKAEIIKAGMELDFPYELTWSCYAGGERACGKCDSCSLRIKGFKEAGFNDPVEYEGLASTGGGRG